MESKRLYELENFLYENIGDFKGFGKHPYQIICKFLDRSIGLDFDRFMGIYVGLTGGSMGTKRFTDKESMYKHMDSVLAKRNVPESKRRGFSTRLVDMLETESFHNDVQESRYYVETTEEGIIFRCGNTGSVL